MKASTLYLRIAIVIALGMVVLASCRKKIEPELNPLNTNLPANKIAPDGFNFKTEKKVEVAISLLTNDNKPLVGVPINIYGTITIEGAKIIYAGVTGSAGNLACTVSVPTNADTIVIDPVYPGLMRYAKVVVKNNEATGVIGGSNGFLGSVVGSLSIFPKIFSGTIKSHANDLMKANDLNGVSTKTSFSYLTKYDANGRPTELVTSDVISSDMLQAINLSLPENDVRLLHPEYLETKAEANIVIEKDADVWITFVSEGAGYMNSIGYYTYTTSKPPANLADIKDIKFIFPNASLKGSNGGMISGDKVKLGRFKAGNTIGFVLFANGWNGSSVDVKTTAYFSNQNLNPERDDNLKKHTVLLSYLDKFLIGFEDLNRESGSDHDFNDALFYATADPVDAISNNAVIVADTPKDADGDGVTDDIDQYPNDAARAYINYFPTKTTYGTLAFEDQWPITGDYDLNDLVVKYQYAWVTNAANQVVELFGNFAPISAGASFSNGLGIQFPFAPTAVSSVTGYKHISNYIRLSANGTESNQTNAVIIPFDNYRGVINNAGGAFFINTKLDMPKVTGDTIKMKISFTSPISLSDFGAAPFNPFLISDLRRGYEVHLPMQKPTSLADLTLFGKGVDASVPASTICYITKENYPWALHFTDTFTYPIEQSSIANSYLFFLPWAASGGNLYRDWFSNTTSTYRNNSLLYTK
jgi:LruC domain-containing protein